jgi:hypothetical protein
MGSGRSELAIVVMDHLAPGSGQAFRSWERVEGMPFDVVAAGTVVACECLSCLDGVNEVADVWAFGDAVGVGHGFADAVAACLAASCAL